MLPSRHRESKLPASCPCLIPCLWGAAIFCSKETRVVYFHFQRCIPLAFSIYIPSQLLTFFSTEKINNHGVGGEELILKLDEKVVS